MELGVEEVQGAHAINPSCGGYGYCLGPPSVSFLESLFYSHAGSRRWNNPIIISTVARTAHGVLHWGGLLQCMYMKGSLKVLSLSDKEWGQFFGWQTPSHPHPQQQQKTNKIQEEFSSHFHQDAMAIRTRDISLNGRTPDLGATTKHFSCLCHSGFALTLGK